MKSMFQQCVAFIVLVGFSVCFALFASNQQAQTIQENTLCAARIREELPAIIQPFTM
ncbi:hypothetical protein QEO94_11710 [Kingella negevensis]|uniref:hypothetical protein n=1 Tax=Kingella negevensis TaxID=1522312 RepID=UPI0025435372|nr:hypothetical protein [Kingella negevensis]WII93263.1 hypothetical protein QEO94_11710 [Kingella negevensis]